jgi:hypothetical protein
MSNIEISKIPKCVFCGKENIELYQNYNSPLYQNFFHDGTVDLFVPGYGSKFDNSNLIIGFCDDFLEKKINSNLILNIGEISYKKSIPPPTQMIREGENPDKNK